MLKTINPAPDDVAGDAHAPTAATPPDALQAASAPGGDPVEDDASPALAAAEAWKIHRGLRDLDHANARVAMLENAKRHFAAIVLNRDPAQALLVWRDCIAIDPSFEPGPQARVQLARMAVDAGDPRSAIELISGFDARFPGHPRVPGAYAVAYDALNALGLAERARRIRASLLARFPGHPAARRLSPDAE